MRKLVPTVALLASACGGMSGESFLHTVEAPTFSPPAGVYAAPQVVTIHSTTLGATVYYASGSGPFSIYTGPVDLPAGTTLQAYAVAAGMNDSPLSTASYDIRLPPAEAPTFSPPPGTYNVPQRVSLASATPGATILYSTDGLAPSLAYAGQPIDVAASLTIRALATAPDHVPSPEAPGAYQIVLLPAAAPTFFPPPGTYNVPQRVSLASATPGATILYSTDGSAPSLAYAGQPIDVATTLTIRALATAPDHTPSPEASAPYVIDLPRAATPAFSPPAGTYAWAQSVTISSATPGASILYSADGSAPALAYAGPVDVSTSLTLRAVATAANHVASDEARAAYVLQVAAPTFSPPPGTYSSAQSVTLASATPGASIFFTTDDAAPPGAFAPYIAPVPVSAASTTIRAFATLTGFLDSALSSGTFVVNIAAQPAAAPTFSPPAGTYGSIQMVSLASATPGASIAWSLDGSSPSQPYLGPVEVAASATLLAQATAPGYTASPVSSASYVINLPAAAAPTFSPPAGTYGSVQSVTIASATPGASIAWSMDGSPPSVPYTGPVDVSASATLLAQASAHGYTPSPVASASYVINLPPAAAPTFSPPAGTYDRDQSVSIASATPGATIRYTSDGSPPTPSSAIYSAPVAVVQTSTLRAFAAAPGFTDSPEARADYVLQAAAPTFSPPAGTYTAAQSVTIASATPGAVIYFTADGSLPTTSSQVYTAPVAVPASATLRALATKAGYSPSAVADAAYSIALPQVATPTFSPPAGTYPSPQSVSISSATAGATIHYTTDGSTPTTSSPVYAAPVAVARPTTVKALAEKAGLSPSAVASATYTITATFASMCQAELDAFRSLEANCLKVNPAYLAAPGPYARAVPCADLSQEIAGSRIAYDAGQGAACVAELPSLGCAALAGGGLAWPPSCLAALAPQVANGGGCYMDQGCQSGSCSSSTTAACPGACQARAALGQSCASVPCAAGLACDGGVCKATSAAGGPCPCQGGLWCDLSGGAPGVCAAPQASGACSAASAGQCAVGTVCAGAPATCRPLVGNLGSCTAAPELCGAGWRCQAGTCVSSPSAALLEACTAADVCIGGYCDLGVPECVPYEPVGQPCDFPYECESGLCSANACAPGYCPPP